MSKSNKYPTGQVTRIKKAAAAIAERCRGAEAEVLELAQAIPVREITANAANYVYELDPQRLLLVDDQIRAIINRWLGLETLTPRWFFADYIGPAYQQGTAEATARIAALLEGQQIGAAFQLESVLLSEPYRRRVELVMARSFNDMRGFAGEAANQLGAIIGNGVAAGISPREIADQIAANFDKTAGWRALRIARTEVNTAYNTARTEATVDARDRLGVEIKVMHRSALLLERTREDHAERHGKIYTPEDQTRWWSQGANRINCYCTTMEIVYINGEPLNKALIERYNKQRQKFLGRSDNATPDN